MRLLQQNKLIFIVLLSMFLYVLMGNSVSFAAASHEDATIDRIQLVTQQITLLKDRLAQEQQELSVLQKRNIEANADLENANKGLLNKSSLDISVSTSNLESINIELNDSQQRIGWLEKNIQEIENQLNVMSIFGLKLNEADTANIKQLSSDLGYQKKLLVLEKTRNDYLEELETASSTILDLQKERLNQINAYLKSRNLLHIKQQQVQDELAFQEQQNHWLKELETLYVKLAKINPQQKTEYTELERSIFYANEMANFAYYQSLIARYKDEIDQMKLAVQRSSSIALLNAISDQTQALGKQISKLDGLLKSRIAILDKHVTNLSERKKPVVPANKYLQQLSHLKSQYNSVDASLTDLSASLATFRENVDHDLQVELSARQGLPALDWKSLMDIGKEILLVPALTYHIVKSMTTHMLSAFAATNAWWWSLFAVMQVFLCIGFYALCKVLKNYSTKITHWDGQINSKWISIQWLRRNSFDLFVIGNGLFVMFYFAIPSQNFLALFYLSIVWLIVKSILTIARLCLAENIQESQGDDMRLYKRLRWLIGFGGLITGLTVFVHQLPMIYDLRALCDGVFLLLLMLVSLFLLRSWRVIPNLIMAQIDYRHPYLRRSMTLVSFLVPLLMFANSIIGLFGYVNLILTVSWYEGVFLLVLIGYLILRGLLTDAMEQLSHLVIQYVNNGWLWTEAILKPIDKVLRLGLFLLGWGVLFLLYGWDNQSPIVARLTALFHYQFIVFWNTSITPLVILELTAAISVFYWAAKWTREFIFRILSSRSADMGIRNSIAILSQYTVVVVGVFLCLRLLGIDLRALAFVASMFALGIGMGLKDLVNNFACGFFILVERPLRVGDIVNISNFEGEVSHIGSRAVTVRTWDNMHMVVPNTEIFNKTFINWTASDNVVRCISDIRTSRADNPHDIKMLITQVLADQKEILKEPGFEVLLIEISDTIMSFEIRYYVNIRQVRSRISVMSSVLTNVWDVFVANGIKPAYQFQEVLLKTTTTPMNLITKTESNVLAG